MLKCPIENVLAAFPEPVKFGRVTFKPLTLESALKLAALGVDIRKHLSIKDLGIAFEVLSSSRLPKKCDLNAALNAVETLINQAFICFIRPHSAGNIELSPSGLGWTLELTEQLCAEYGWTWEYAIKCPLARAFALQAAARQRHGHKHGGPDYIERPIIEKMTIDKRKE